MKSAFIEQLKQNLLAIISLIIAISALSYTSWRNEQSEYNRNQRTAGFEILRESSHLQLLVDRATYDTSSEKADPIQGWVRVNLILSLAKLTVPSITQTAEQLKQTWQNNWELVYTSEEANRKVSDAIESLNQSVREHLKSLN